MKKCVVNTLVNEIPQQELVHCTIMSFGLMRHIVALDFMYVLSDSGLHLYNICEERLTLMLAPGKAE